MNKKRILLITTGGTIASKDNGLGLTPQINSKEILSYLDDILDVCDIDTYELFNLEMLHDREISNQILEKEDKEMYTIFYL